jgi:hypothetical protein
MHSGKVHLIRNESRHHAPHVRHPDLHFAVGAHALNRVLSPLAPIDIEQRKDVRVY